MKTWQKLGLHAITLTGLFAVVCYVCNPNEYSFLEYWGVAWLGYLGYYFLCIIIGSFCWLITYAIVWLDVRFGMFDHTKEIL
jgi:hypothetical protein